MAKRVRKRKKKKIKIVRLLIAIIILFMIIFGLIKLIPMAKNSIKLINKEYYLS